MDQIIDDEVFVSEMVNNSNFFGPRASLSLDRTIFFSALYGDGYNWDYLTLLSKSGVNKKAVIFPAIGRSFKTTSHWSKQRKSSPLV